MVVIRYFVSKFSWSNVWQHCALGILIDMKMSVHSSHRNWRVWLLCVASWSKLKMYIVITNTITENPFNNLAIKCKIWWIHFTLNFSTFWTMQDSEDTGLQAIICGYYYFSYCFFYSFINYWWFSVFTSHQHLLCYAVLFVFTCY